MNETAGYCEPCDWTGPTRTDNLRALADYDRHMASAGHKAMLADAAMPKPGELVDVAGADTPSTIVEVINVEPGPNYIEVIVQVGIGDRERLWLRPEHDEEHGHRIWHAL